MTPLVCPHCREALTVTQRQWRCANGHHFDVARGGYVNLAARVIPTGDTSAMLTHRRFVFDSGVYAPLIDAVQRHVSVWLKGHTNPLVCDVGAGTGDMLAAVLAGHANAHGIAFDASPHAAKAAQRAHERIQAVVTDAWQPLPLADNSVTVMMSVFAPRNAVEFRRVLTANGAVVIVSAGTNHVRELRDRYDLIAIDDRKNERITQAFANGFMLTQTDTLTWQFACHPKLAYAMIAMGPNAHHMTLEPEDVTFSGDVTAEVTVHVFRPDAAGP
ncbi:MAG: methyltransferase domain-containing protein [Nitriliruptoraceae bacterium]